MPTSTCRDVYEHSDALVSEAPGNADDATLAPLEAHVAGCIHCQNHLHELRAALRILKSLDTPGPSVVEQAKLTEIYRTWSEQRHRSIWKLCWQKRHWAWALRVSAVAVPVLTVVNHWLCISHLEFGLACLGQSLAVGLIPFAAAVYASARSELVGQP